MSAKLKVNGLLVTGPDNKLGGINIRRDIRVAGDDERFRDRMTAGSKVITSSRSIPSDDVLALLEQYE